ncbi:MAG: condensation domain-containing protein, partial [Gammaproteobacteria bacterium]
MKPPDVITLLQEKGVSLVSEGNDLVVRAPRGAMSSELLAWIRSHKQGLIAELEISGSNVTVDAPLTITPDLLSLITLTQSQIDHIVNSVPHGAANVQDIYPLAPLQEGILFHHLLETERDPYLLRTILAFDSRSRLDTFVAALQMVIDRHDALRTAVLWQELPQPVQVVYRHARLPVEELAPPTEGGVLEHLLGHTDPHHTRLDVQHAPLLAATMVYDPDTDEWLLAIRFHHLAIDHITLKLILAEVRAVLLGQADSLPQALPYRNFVAHTLVVSTADHEAYFRRQLGDVDQPTAPFDQLDVYGDGDRVGAARLPLSPELAERIRRNARQQGVSAAVLFHLAWAQVLAQCSGRDDVVFGTVLFGRMQGLVGTDLVAAGMFVNTLPLRVPLAQVSVREAIAGTHQGLSQLLVHEQASLALAQRCSAVPASMPLFTALLNYRDNRPTLTDAAAALAWDGMRVLAVEERTNYPITMSVEDWGEGFGLSAQCTRGIDPQRLVAYLVTAIEGLIGAMERQPHRLVLSLNILPPAERQRLLIEFNDTATDYARDRLIHELFEAQAEARPGAIAVSYE